MEDREATAAYAGRIFDPKRWDPKAPLRVVLIGSDFQVRVWEALLRIPMGCAVTYSSIAEKLGNPKAVRAVGQANAHNPIAIVVPCHRVIAKTGDLQGYFYGLGVKRQLLELENPMSFARQGDLFG